ncbi:MAG: 30S ribosomal protein S17 [bacterium]|nr:30S ribosomal protein S17 [bacterium]
MTQDETSKEIAKTRVTSRRQLEGVVASTAMQKTITVRVDRRVAHAKYGKYFTVSKKFKAHDEHAKASVGDTVVIEETRPLSKDKHWRLTRIVRSAS